MKRSYCHAAFVVHEMSTWEAPLLHDAHIRAAFIGCCLATSDAALSLHVETNSGLLRDRQVVYAPDHNPLGGRGKGGRGSREETKKKRKERAKEDYDK